MKQPLLSVVSSAPHWLQQHRLAGLPVSRHLMLLLNRMDDKGHFTPGWVFLFLAPQVAMFPKCGKGHSHLISLKKLFFFPKLCLDIFGMFMEGIVKIHAKVFTIAWTSDSLLHL